MLRSACQTEKPVDRHNFIGGSDARVIMGDDESALLRLWREKRGESRAGGSVGQSGGPARLGHRGPQPALVRVQYRADSQGRPEARKTPGLALDGGDPGRRGRGHRRGVRGQVHAALGLFGRGCRGKAYGPAAAQYVGDPVKVGRAVDHYRRRQMGRTHDSMPIRSTSICC